MSKWVILQVCYLYSLYKTFGGKTARKGPLGRARLSGLVQVATKEDPNIVEFN
jgi:hypothetical protein